MAKISFKKGVADCLLFVIVFVVIQFFVMLTASVIKLIWDHVNISQVMGDLASGNDPALLAITSVFSSVITFMVFLKLGWTPITRTYLQSKPWLTLLWVALFAIGAIIPLELIYEHLGLEMDDNTSQLFEGLLKEPWGYVAVGVLAPLVEEMVFRGALLRTLLGMVSKKNHWIAIMVSAFVFGLVHGNMAQFVNAMIMGLMLGWMYYRTKSIVPGILLHWVNNTMAFVLYNILPQSDGKLIDIFGGNETTVYYAVGFSLCIMIPSFIQLLYRLERANHQGTKG